MLIFRATSFLICLMSAPVFAQPVTQIFDLPLGGKVKMPVRACRFDEIGSDNLRTICWVGPPSIFKGTRSGSIGLPGADKRPRWAAYATFEASIDKDGTLSEISVWSRSAVARNEIIASIESRFGLPSEASPASEVSASAAWHQKDVHIKMLCSPSIGCRVSFSSAAAFENLQRELRERRTKDAARAQAP
jgi:hypothetical protein